MSDNIYFVLQYPTKIFTFFVKIADKLQVLLS